jgi:hypothetical protein
MRVLFLNHKQSRCGVYSYGIRLYNIWKKSSENIITYQEVSSIEEYNNIIFDFDTIIYNYHCMTMGWLSSDNINNNIKSIGIWHEGPIDISFTRIIDVSTTIPRPIFENIPDSIENTNEEIINFLNYSNGDIPIIGSFGFGFNSKGFDKIITNVCNTFDNAIIKLIITISEFGDRDGSIAQQINDTCYNLITKSGIELKIINNYLSDNDILYFLNKNDINVFLYNEENNRGLSSVIDFAYSVDRPICISNSYMFRHIYSDNISIQNKSIKECIIDNIDYIKTFRKNNSHSISLNYIDKLLTEL